MVERVLGAIFENATPPTKAYVTRWGSDPCESACVCSLARSLARSHSRSPHTTVCVFFCVGARGAYE
jgi:hypothetical protein